MSAITTRRKGVSLAKGPIAIVGMLGIAMGVCGLIFGGHGFHIAGVPHGSIYGNRWLGIELNGWTNLLFIAAGLFLLLFSPAHWGAKAAAWIVAGVLGAAAIIAVIRGNGIFGIFAADHRTEIIWGAAAVVLLVLSLLPRVGRREAVVQQPSSSPGAPPATRDEPAVTRDRGVIGGEPGVARREPASARTEPAETPEQAATNRYRPAATPEERDPAVPREPSGASRAEPAATGEQPDIARANPDVTRQEPSVERDDPRPTGDDSDATPNDAAATHADELVWPRDRPSTSSEEPPARS